MGKKEIKKIADELISTYPDEEFWYILGKQILEKRIKFTYLDYLGKLLYENLKATKCLKISQKLVDLDYEGGFMIIGSIFRQYIHKNLDRANKIGCKYIIKGNKWYVCDTFAEWVFGDGLFLNFKKQYEYLKEYLNHDNTWIKRVVGISTHYAAKNGIEETKLIKLIDLILTQINDKTYHVKKGCGYAFETIAKFYPELALRYKDRIFNSSDTTSWVKKKFNLGIEKSKKYKKSSNAE